MDEVEGIFFSHALGFQKEPPGSVPHQSKAVVAASAKAPLVLGIGFRRRPSKFKMELQGGKVWWVGQQAKPSTWWMEDTTVDEPNWSDQALLQGTSPQTCAAFLSPCKKSFFVRKSGNMCRNKQEAQILKEHAVMTHAEVLSTTWEEGSWCISLTSHSHINSEGHVYSKNMQCMVTERCSQQLGTKQLGRRRLVYISMQSQSPNALPGKQA